MWFWTLLILAVIAYFVIKSMTGKSSSTDSSAEGTSARLESSGATVESTASAADEDASSAPGAASTATAAAAGAISAGASAVNAQATRMVNNLPDLSVSTGNATADIQEMIKILNLAVPDAGRLGVSKETFAALRAGNDVSAEDIDGVADKLRQMLA